MPTIEVCFTPELYIHKHTQGKHITLIIDVMRASTSICAALYNNVKAIIPVCELEELKRLKQVGYLIASEREGLKLDFADMGNSPSQFLDPNLKGSTIAYSTTNGTRAISLINEQDETTIYIAALTNLDLLCDFIHQSNENVVIVCSGWKHEFSLEDAVVAGAYCENLIQLGNYETSCDASTASIDLWKLAKTDLPQYIEKCKHKHRLTQLGLEESIPFCLDLNSSPVIPIVKNGMITRLDYK